MSREEFELFINDLIFPAVMERNGINQRNVHSTPSSPQGRAPNSFEVIGSAESLVGRVS